MRTECISDINFKGQIIKTSSNFSAKPQQSLASAENSINDLIKSKPFDLYIHQDYSKNEIVFETDLVGISKRIPITSKTSKYIETVKSTIEEHENTESAAKLEEWEKENNKEEIKETLALMFLPVILILGMIYEGIENLKKDFNKIAKKLATKKG